MKRRTAFSLVELLVVLTIIAVLCGLTMGAAAVMMESGRKTKARGVVDKVRAAIETYSIGPDRLLPVTATLAVRLWDSDDGGAGARGDGFLDGEPGKDPGFTGGRANALTAVGYRGFLLCTGFTVSPSEIDRTTGRLRDPWGYPLRIGYRTAAPGPFAGMLFGVWSCGNDGQTTAANNYEADFTNPARNDDVKSW